MVLTGAAFYHKVLLKLSTFGCLSSASRATHGCWNCHRANFEKFAVRIREFSIDLLFWVCVGFQARRLQ